MKIIIVKDQITKDELRELAQEFYIEMVKGVVDVENEILALGGEFHIDANTRLIEEAGSLQPNIWGFNIYFDKNSDDMIEYTSLINIRPAQGNRALEVQDQVLKDRMKNIIMKYIQ